MAAKYTPPAISVSMDPDTEEFCLMATSHARTCIAGPRILRAEPWPAIKFRHATEEGAERDARELRAYLADCANGKRKEAEDKPRRRGWWE